MTTPTANSRSTYTGNGVTTVFSTGFYFLDQSHVVVKLTLDGGSEVVQTLGVHYTVTMPASVGAVGSVTMLTAPAADSSLVIERTVPYTQATSFRTQGSFSPATHENAFDFARHVDQQLARRVSDLESAGTPGSVVAGNGLAFSGDTLHIGAGDGIVANADDIEIDYGAAGDMVAVTRASASAGTSATAARIDHKHDVSTAAAGAIAIGDSAAEGSATSLARSDHTHSVAAPAAPANVTKDTASAGVATTFARADHKHDITTATAIELTDSSNTEGNATTLARSNHTHSHGVRGGGSLHAAATNAVAGFMSAADKASMEAIGTVALKSRVIALQAASQSIADATGTVLTTWTEGTDSDGEFNPTTGVYTAKAAGAILIAVQVLADSAAWAAGDTIEIGARKNGTYVQGIPTRAYFDASATRTALVEQVRFTTVGVGDTIDILVTHDQGGSVNMQGWLHIQRIV